MLDPITSLLEAQSDGVLAVIVGVEGRSYRPLGAQMYISVDGSRYGNLSAGCIEADIAVHARACLKSGAPLRIIYGRGSPYLDVRLPCGGGLEILLLPKPDRAVLAELNAQRRSRQVSGLKIDLTTGALELAQVSETARSGEKLVIRFEPALEYMVFGKGPEAKTFVELVASAGFRSTLLSPDKETLEGVVAPEITKRHLVKIAIPVDCRIDKWTAIILFFHDHEWEPPILETALKSTAFYIGAQGSFAARAARDVKLADRGVSAANISRLRGPIGLIPSARDATTLAVSVFAETLAYENRTV